MKDENIIKSLHILERKVLPFLSKTSELSELVDKSGLTEVEVMRALQWLANKEIITLKEEVMELIDLDDNGREYLEKGLPEIRFLKALKTDPLAVNDISKIAEIKKDELNICLGSLKKKAAIEITKNNNTLLVSITEPGKKLLSKESLEEKFLHKVFPMDIKSLAPQDKFALDNLKKRKKIIRIDIKKKKFGILTDLGNELVKIKINSNVIDTLTSKLIKSGKWKGQEFRGYDLKATVPSLSGGKKHFVNQSIDYIKRIWLDLGFTEMKGNFVQTAFWDLDSLFVPQDHPARQMQDTFYIKDPKDGKIPSLSKKVKAVHEDGADTGSKGWGSKWSQEVSKENLLRTHTTVLSAQTIAKLKESNLPAKFFSVGKVFRNEALDWKHLFEFYQVEGIVVDPDANFSNLLGYLKEFFKKMGYLDVRIRPGHFPYTEPSAEVDVLHPVRKEWVELGGAGIFRPEVTKTLFGKEIPVLAWGLGMGRIISEYYKITDIRDLYKNDLKQIKEIKYWLK